MSKIRVEHTFFFQFRYLLYLVSKFWGEAQDMENNIINVSVIGRHFSKKQRFLCKFKITKLNLSTIQIHQEYLSTEK